MSNILDEEAALQAQMDNDDDDGSSGSENEDEEAVLKSRKTDSKNSRGRKGVSSGGGGGRVQKQLDNVGETVLYIGHLPTILGEMELKQFLGQFGKVLHLELARSKKTGRSRGFCFCQMQSAEVARIVADTLSGYLLMGEKRLVCHVVPPEKVRRSLFLPSHAKKDPHEKYLKQKQENQRMRHERPLEKMKAITSKMVARERKLRQRIKDMGIDYDFPGYEASVAAHKEAAELKQEHENSDEEGLEDVKNGRQDESHKKRRKRKDSVGSVDSSASDKKKGRKRKDSVGSVESSSSDKKHRKERKDSVGSVESSSSDKKGRKRKDSVGSVDSISKKERKRKNSVGSVDDSETKERKRKDSVGSVEHSEKKGRKRKDSIGSVGSSTSNADDSSSKKKKKSKRKST